MHDLRHVPPPVSVCRHPARNKAMWWIPPHSRKFNPLIIPLSVSPPSPPIFFSFIFFNSSVGSVGSHAGKRQKVSMWWSLEAALLTVGVACRHISAALVLIGIWTWPWVGVSSTPPGSVSLPPAGANSSLRSRTWADLTKNRRAVILFHRQIKCERQKGVRRRLCATSRAFCFPSSVTCIYLYLHSSPRQVIDRGHILTFPWRQ